MLGVVAYTDEQPPTNRYVHQFIAPPQAGICCFSEMEWLDGPQMNVRWVYQDRRCPRCGFAVRVILHEISDAALATTLRESPAHSFLRNVPE